MKKIIIGLVALIFIGISCKQEEPNAEPSLTILSVSKDTLNVSDTISITYEINGFDSFLDIIVLIDGHACEVVSNSGSIVEAIVPYGLENSRHDISLKYQDYISSVYHINIDINPKITVFFPNSGVGGDTLRIVGFGFDKLIPVKIIRVNSLPAEIISSSDTLLIALIPEGCGNGKIRLQSYYAPGNTYNGEIVYWLEREIVCGNFKYNFKPYTGNTYPIAHRIQDGSSIETITYERRDNILHRKIYSSSKYDIYKYSDGVIDSILNYENDTIISYETFLVHAGSDEIVHNFYNYNGIRQKYYVYKLHNNTLAEWNSFEYSELLNDFYNASHNSYTQELDRYIIDRTIYDTDGSIHYHPIYKGFLDIENIPLDFNIPGYPLSQYDVWVYNGENTYHNYYNEYGLLIKRVRCPLNINETSGYIQEYEYE